MNYECLPYDNFPPSSNWHSFLDNGIIQAQESLQIHWQNFADMVCRRKVNSEVYCEIKALIKQSKKQVKMFQLARNEYQNGNIVPARRLRDAKVERLNLEVNQILHAGGKRITVEPMVREMNDIRGLK